MSNLSIIPVRALYDTRITTDDISLLNVICIHTDEDGYCFPSLETISGIFSPLAGRSKPYDDSTISRKLSRLEQLGYLSNPAQRKTAGGGFSSNQYKILYDVELPLEFDRRKMQAALAKSRRKNQAALENASVKNQTNVPGLTSQINESAKPALAPIEKPKPPKSPAAKKAIALAGSALQEWEQKTDAERARGDRISSPRNDRRAFIDEFSPMMAKVMNHPYPLSEDRGAVGDIFAYHCDRAWLAERLTALGNGSGEEYRHPTKDGKRPVAYWVRDRIEREWAEYRQERDNAERRRQEREHYERECAAAIAEAREQGIQLSGGEPQPDCLHLPGAPTGTGEPSDREHAGDERIAVAAPRVVQMQGDGMGVPGLSRGDVGAGARQGQSVREMYRDELRRRHTAAVARGVPEPTKREGDPGG